MPKPYESGTKKQIVNMMAEYAIRDQEALIDACKGGMRPGNPNPETQHVIQEAEAAIRDFKRFCRTFRNYEPSVIHVSRD